MLAAAVAFFSYRGQTQVVSQILSAQCDVLRQMTKGNNTYFIDLKKNLLLLWASDELDSAFPLGIVSAFVGLSDFLLETEQGT